MSEQREIGRKPFSFRGLAIAGVAGVLVVAVLYAAFGNLPWGTRLAMSAAAALLVLLALFLDRSWAAVRRYVILGSDGAPRAAASPPATREPQAPLGYLRKAVAATVLPLAAALIVGALVGELVSTVIFGVVLAGVANMVVFAVWRVVPLWRGRQ